MKTCTTDDVKPRTSRASRQSKWQTRNMGTEQKIHAVDRILGGESIAHVSRDIHVAESTIRGWRKNLPRLRSLLAIAHTPLESQLPTRTMRKRDGIPIDSVPEIETVMFPVDENVQYMTLSATTDEIPMDYVEDVRAPFSFGPDPLATIPISVQQNQATNDNLTKPELTVSETCSKFNDSINLMAFNNAIVENQSNSAAELAAQALLDFAAFPRHTTDTVSSIPVFPNYFNEYWTPKPMLAATTESQQEILPNDNEPGPNYNQQ